MTHHTHPLYRQLFTCDDDPELYASSDRQPRPLDAALAEAQRCTGGGLRYYVAPVRGSEPRYTLRVHGPNGAGSAVSWPPCVAQRWPVVCAEWHRRAEPNAGFHNTDWPLTYRVVAA